MQDFWERPSRSHAIYRVRMRPTNNNNNNPICKAPECQKTSVALKDFRGAKIWKAIQNVENEVVLG